MPDLTPFMALQDEAGDREPPKVLAGGFELDLQRGGDLPQTWKRWATL